ncbi:stage V sporulation protein AA [Lachnospiraceae bacterium OttesenSCG-928-D06]|nr:stage V sporulation protein AA [Lachnospiraceae bacterium OttesenSCG-928-D06]
MPNVTVYLKCDRDVEVQSEDVYLKDLGSLRCADSVISAKLKALKVYHFTKDTQRVVISAIKLITLMETACPGITVDVIGEVDILIEKVTVKQYKGFSVWCKIFMVCLVSFCGTAFTIMAYHNDVGINEVFKNVYEIVMNKEPEGLNILEVAYSIGLGAGIIVFFNHIGGRRITKDPTPIEVAMRNYEEDVNKALIETAGREGKEIDS